MLSDHFKDHILNPRNLGDMDRPDSVGEVTGPECGDMMTVQIRVAEGRITDIRFRTFGCWAAIGAASMVTEWALGKTLERVKEVNVAHFGKDLEGLPEDKHNCIRIGLWALRQAVADYDRHKAGHDMERDKK
jgi:nitrogen fixation NifU-like protein